jgi:SPP1 gp7 family putative phage head morphogenesis protein
MAKTANEELMDALIRHQTYLLRYSGYVRNRMWSILDESEESIADKIIARLANNKGLTTGVEFRRLEALVDAISTIRSEAWGEANEFLQQEMVKLALQETVSINDLVKVALPVQIETVMPTAGRLRAIATARPFQGRIMKDWAASMEAEDLRRIHSSIQTGMVAGEDMQSIARRVVGTRALAGTDGVTELTRRQVQAITRTAVMHVSNAARSAYFHENADIVTGEYFVATLDSRTTPICRANDGKTFDLGKGPVPPLHFNCRSLRIAAIDGTLLGDRPAKPFVERELLDQYQAERMNVPGKLKDRNDLPHGTKGDYDKWRRNRIRQLTGPVPASTTYNEWLKGQTKTFQDDTLGIEKAKLFRGGLPLDKFVNRNGDELTLGQLAKREKDAFRAAGLNPDDF